MTDRTTESPTPRRTPPPSPSSPRPPRAAPATRRAALRTLFVAGPALGVAAALSPILAARQGDPAAAPARGETAQPPTGAVLFDEYRAGRHLRGTALPDGGAAVTVDGRPLHLMRRADGGWLSMLDHYESYPTPREAALAAVRELGSAQLA